MFGNLLKVTFSPPSHDGPPYVHEYRPPVEAYDEDGEPEAYQPPPPSYTIETIEYTEPA